MKKVATIGSRSTPGPILTLMENIGAYLVSNGYIISTGNAKGADQAFARGANRVNPKLVRLYLPWPSYEIENIVPYNEVIPYQEESWLTEAAKYHPKWSTLKDSVKKLHARNVGIVKGACQIIAFPNNNKIGGGGTGMGLRLAEAYSIPLIDLSKQEDVQRILEKINESSD